MRAALLVLLLLAAPLALAIHTPQGKCGSDGWPAQGVMWLNQGDREAWNDFYVDDRNYLLGNGLWVYQETNGWYDERDVTHALQRGGASWVVPDDRETCVDEPTLVPDALLL